MVLRFRCTATANPTLAHQNGTGSTGAQFSQGGGDLLVDCAAGLSGERQGLSITSDILIRAEVAVGPSVTPDDEPLVGPSRAPSSCRSRGLRRLTPGRRAI